MTNFTKLNRATKKAQGIIDAYKASNACTLWDVYGKYSSEKRRAFDDCTATMQANNGYDLKIISASKYLFTVAFLTINSDGNRCLMCITRNNNYVITLNVDDIHDWMDDWMARFNDLDENNKKRILNSNVNITSRAQADEMLRFAEQWDVLFKMGVAKQPPPQEVIL